MPKLCSPLKRLWKPQNHRKNNFGGGADSSILFFTKCFSLEFQECYNIYKNFESIRKNNFGGGTQVPKYKIIILVANSAIFCKMFHLNFLNAKTSLYLKIFVERTKLEKREFWWRSQFCSIFFL